MSLDPWSLWLVFFGAAFFFGLAGIQILGGSWERYEATYAKGAERTLDAAWLSMPPQVLVYLSVASALVFGLLGALSMGSAWGALPFALAGLSVPRALLWMVKRRRDAKFGIQLVDALSNMSNSMKAGLSLPQSMEMIAREMDNPIRQEFGLVAQEMRVGLPLPEAMGNLVRRMPSQDLDLMSTSIDISREVGGNLTEVLEKIAGTIRERHRIEGKIKALTAQGRLQGVVMSLLPVAVGVVLKTTRPGYFEPILTTSLGWFMLGAIFLMLVVGTYFVFKIVNIEV